MTWLVANRVGMRATGKINRAAVIDLDVHQGDGTSTFSR